MASSRLPARTTERPEGDRPARRHRPHSWREHVETALHGRHPRFGRFFELLLLTTIAVSSIAMGVETVPGMPLWTYSALAVMDTVFVAVFTIEYVLRIAVAENRRRYVFSFYGLVDLLSILPFFIGLFLGRSVVDLKLVRTLRLFRLLRMFKLARYTRATDRLVRAWKIVREEVIVFGAAALIVLYVCAMVIYQFEHPAQPEAFSSVLDAMWWAAITLTTVGYGDIYPVTAMGRIFTVLMLLVALGIIAIPTGLVSSALTSLRGAEADKAKEDVADKDLT
jgi:voltage-gated potassium channel